MFFNILCSLEIDDEMAIYSYCDPLDGLYKVSFHSEYGKY